MASQPDSSPTEPIQPESSQPERGRTSAKQRLVILGVAVFALVLLLLTPLLLGGGPAGPEVAVSPAPSGTGVPEGAATAAPPATTTTTTPPTAGSATLTAKDPFKPLVAAAGSAAPAGSDILPATGGAGEATTTTSAGGTSPGGGASAGRRLTLLDVFRRGGVRYVKVDLDGKSYQAAEGGTVASLYRVVDVGTSCAEFRSSTGAVFTLCEGEAVLK